MAETDPNNADSWRKPELRRNVLQKIEEAITNSGNALTKTSVEMERHIFTRARTREEYLSFVARLLIHFKDSRRNMQQQQGSMPVGQQQVQQMIPQQQQQPPQMNIQQQQQTNQQINAMQHLQTQNQQQQLKSQQQSMSLNQTNPMTNMTIQQLQQQQMLSNSNMSINMTGLNVGCPPGSNKMNTLNQTGTDNVSSDVPNMINMKNAKQLSMNPQISGNMNVLPGAASTINTLQNINTGNFSGNNATMNINTANINVNNMVNTNNSGISTNIGNTSAQANIVLNSNMKQKIIPGLMSNTGANISNANIGANHVTINQLQQTNQSMQANANHGQSMTMPQQLVHQHHHHGVQQQQQQQQSQQQPQTNRMIQPNTNMATILPNARMMMNQNIRQQQQSTQINLTPNMQTHLRMRQPAPNSNLQQAMSGMQQSSNSQPNSSMTMYIQQQPQGQNTAQIQAQQQAVMGQQQAPQANYEITQTAQQRATPVTVSQQFKSTILNPTNSIAPGYGNTFSPNMTNSQQHAIPTAQQAAVARQMNVANMNVPSGPTSSIMQSNEIVHPTPVGNTLNKKLPNATCQMVSNKLLSVPNQVLAGSPMIGSPSNYHGSSPASVNNVMMPSPASRQPHSIDTLSPQNSTLNTPVSVPPRNSVSNEDTLYQEKLQSLQKFIEPLYRGLQQNEKENPGSKEVEKMRKLYQILTGSMPSTMLLLERCEKFFIDNYEKPAMNTGKPMHMQQSHGADCSPATSIPSVPPLGGGQVKSVGPPNTMNGMNIAVPTSTTITSQGGGVVPANELQDACQSLVDVIERYSNKPMFVHTLHRTFGPAVAVLCPEPYLNTNRVNVSGNYVYYSNTSGSNKQITKKRKYSESDLMSIVLQGEIARLDFRYKVEPLAALGQNQGKNSQHLLCRLDDTSLPCVPPIIVYITDKYPEIPPYCVLEPDDYEESDYSRSIYKYFQNNLLKMQGCYTLTSLLHTWNRSVHQAICSISEEIKVLN